MTCTSPLQNQNSLSCPGHALRRLSGLSLLGLLCGLISACAARSPAPSVAAVDLEVAEAQCVMEETLPWLEANWGDPGESRPEIMVVNDRVLDLLIGRAAESQSGAVYGLSMGSQIWLLDRLDFSNWSGQEIVVHELAHWIDHRLDRERSHREVYALAHKWAVENHDVDC